MLYIIAVLKQLIQLFIQKRGVSMLSINYKDPRPIYEQVRDALRQLILSGAIAPGEKLPGRFFQFSRKSWGSMGSSSCRTAKCRWGPRAVSLRELLPTAPMACPARTLSPAFTGTSGARLA